MSVPDNEAIYDERIFPLMQQILAICKEHKLPMAATFECAPDLFCSSMLLFGGDGDLVKDVARRIERSIAGPPRLQITTTKADGSKVIEVILP